MCPKRRRNATTPVAAAAKRSQGCLTALSFSCLTTSHVQATEQGDQEVHSLSLLLRSHEPVLHALDSRAVLHFLPPFFDFVMVLRAWPWTPPSPSLDHLLHEGHLDITQSTGHLICSSAGWAQDTHNLNRLDWLQPARAVTTVGARAPLRQREHARRYDCGA